MLAVTLGLAGSLLFPATVSAQSDEIEPQVLTWARVDFLRNRVQLVPRDQRGRRAQIADLLSVGDSLRTSRASRAELRFNDGSLARIGERATFRFTPNTRNFQLSNGTILLLIPPGRGRSTIQTPNAVTGIQGSALFVRYIPETDTTIVGALTNNPDGPMVLFNRDGTEQQALRANEIGVIEGDQITELYQFDGTLFWQSSGLAEGFNYLGDASSTGSDALDGVRQEIREAIANQKPITDGNVIVNPDSFARPTTDTPDVSDPGTTGSTSPTDAVVPDSQDSGTDVSTPVLSGTTDDTTPGDTSEPVLEFEDSPAENYLEGSEGQNPEDLNIGVNNNLTPSVSSGDDQPTVTTATPTNTPIADDPENEVDPTLVPDATDNKPTLPTPSDDGDDLIAVPSEPSTPTTPSTPPAVAGPGADAGVDSDGDPVLQPLPPSALTDDTPDVPDAGPEAPVLDADQEVPEAPVPDAPVPDAAPEVPDVPAPDAAPEVPDAPVPDAAPDVPDIPVDTGSDVPAAPDVPDSDFIDGPAGSSTELVPSLILPEDIPSSDMTVPPETLDATPALVDDPTLSPVPFQVEAIDELPTPATEELPMPQDMDVVPSDAEVP